jgi:soluble lytic murein transglycosylase
MGRTKRHTAGWILAAIAAALLGGPALAAPKHPPLPPARPAMPAAAKPAPLLRQVPLPRQRPRAAGRGMVSAYAEANAGLGGAPSASGARFKPLARPVAGPFAIASTTSTSAADLAALKQVIEAARKGKDADANAAERTISDPVARKLAEWVILRSDNTSPGFQRYANFINANPAWPHVPLFRRRAENALWDDQVSDAEVLAFFAKEKPATAKGHFMLAHVLLDRGDRAGAAALVRQAWRYQDCSAEVEGKVLALFGDLLTRADHRARMDRRFYEDDVEAGLRQAKRLGGSELAIAKAWAAVIQRKRNALALLNAVPAAARHDAGYIFARVVWLRHADKLKDAVRLVLTAPHDAESVVDPDQWWRERRILVRDLLDRHEPRTAYRIAIEAATPTRRVYRVDKYFTAGWVALRFLHDAKTAAALFAHIPQGTDNPYALSRGGYWQGRAAEAMGHYAQAKKFYEMAARHTATYYGQLARARLGFRNLGLRGQSDFTPQERRVLGNLEVVRAAELLYALDQRDMLASIFAEIGQSGHDIAGMAMLAGVAAKHHDGRAMVLLGEYALNRGLPLDYFAFPTVGLPDYKPIAPPLAPAVTYSIARQESHFNQKVVSSAHAMGLMQVTPEACKDTAMRYKVRYSRSRLLTDPVYNMQMGAAELSNLLHGYNGSYLLTFAAYNAGRGRVKQWINVYGDPRDPKVDPVDWVERLPFSETRNYVMRIMENLQVYRARFGGSGKLMIEADLYRGRTN